MKPELEAPPEASQITIPSDGVSVGDMLKVVSVDEQTGQATAEIMPAPPEKEAEPANPGIDEMASQFK